MSAPNPRAATRLIAFAYLTGAAIGLASMVLPQPAGQDDLGIYIVLGLAFAGGCALLAAGSWRPLWLVSGALAATTLLVVAGIHASGQPTSVYALFHVGTAVVAFLVLERRLALAQVGVIAAGYGWLMVVDGSDGATERWLVTVSSALIIGLVVGRMRDRVDALVVELSANVERLATAAMTDPLTGLLNRRGFDEGLERELSRMDRGGVPPALVLCDLDRFKDVNDALGHPAGDLVLQRVAAAFSSAVRDIDVIARIGGEEFGVVLPGTDEAGALAVAERLRTAIEQDFAGDGVTLTTSCGLATAADHPAPDALLRAADTALYAAKQLGRNRAVPHRPHLAAMLRLELDASLTGDSPLRTMLALSEALDLRDGGTARHSQTVAAHAETMAHALGCSSRQAARVRLAGLLHDVGKIGVSDAVLRKPGPLDETEWAEMRAHPEIGAKLLGPVVGDLGEWVLAHHERLDGTGYPRGLVAAEIPLEARILAVADAYEAMTADRPYRRALGEAAAARELRAGAGTQFDAEIVETFLAELDRCAAAPRGAAAGAGRAGPSAADLLPGTALRRPPP